jgi:tetratricopeptide (TPR) repeat protein
MTRSNGPGSESAPRGDAAAQRRTASERPDVASDDSASLYERYKDALRRGHVAALRGRHDAAIDAYGEAAEIAPDRALPHASIGGILAKMNRPADAIASYRRALDIAPNDETGLRGIAEALVRLGRRAEAAAALDRLADGLDAAGRLADATDAARRALELAESRTRRTHLEALVSHLRASESRDETADRALEKAAAVVAAPEPSTDDTSGAAAEVAPWPALATDAVDAVPAPQSPDAGFDTAVEPAAGETLEATDAQPEPIAEPAGLGIALGVVAEAQLHAGELGEARDGLLAAARAHRRAGRLVAAVDACDLAISIAPADPDVHLLLAELYLDRGWRSLASEKLQLLGRITMLDGDAGTRERLCAIAGARLPEDGRLAELCS